jgi:hypothetical protein
MKGTGGLDTYVLFLKKDVDEIRQATLKGNAGDAEQEHFIKIRTEKTKTMRNVRT